MKLDGLIETLIVLFLILILGYMTGKKKLFSPSIAKDLSAMILSVTMPCLILGAALRSAGEPNIPRAILVLVASGITYLVLPFLGIAISYLFRVKPEERRLYQYMTTFSNVAYIGYPIVGALLGEEMIIYASISSLVFNLLNFTLGAHWMSGGREKQRAISVVLNPGVISSIVAIVFFFASVKFPEPLTKAIVDVGNMTTPLAMIVIGLNLAQSNPRVIFGQPKMYAYVLVRMFCIPPLLWLGYRLCIGEAQLVALMTVIGALPIATAGVLFANRFDYQVEEMTAGVFLSTLLCLASIPLLVQWLLM